MSNSIYRLSQECYHFCLHNNSFNKRPLQKNKRKIIDRFVIEDANSNFESINYVVLTKEVNHLTANPT